MRYRNAKALGVAAPDVEDHPRTVVAHGLYLDAAAVAPDDDQWVGLREHELLGRVQGVLEIEHYLFRRGDRSKRHVAAVGRDGRDDVRAPHQRREPPRDVALGNRACLVRHPLRLLRHLLHRHGNLASSAQHPRNPLSEGVGDQKHSGHQLVADHDREISLTVG